MGNLNGNLQLFITRIDKGSLNEKSLIDIFEKDGDFLENEDYFRDDTLSLGYKNEAERVSKEIFNKVKSTDEADKLEKMVKAIFNVTGFIGKSSYYGNYEYDIIDTEFEYIIIIAVES